MNRAIPKCTKGQRFSTLLPLPLKENVDEDTVTYLKERSEDFPGIEIVEQWKRVLSVRAAGQSRRRLPRPDHQGERRSNTRRRATTPTSSSARSASSCRWRTSLHGSWGKQVFEVDAAGGIVRELLDQHVDPIAGATSS